MSFSLHQRPPYRAEHLGSLLRTQDLLGVRHAIDGGATGKDAELKAVEDKDIKEIVQKQEELGYKAVTDGEYRRHSMFPVIPLTLPLPLGGMNDY